MRCSPSEKIEPNLNWFQEELELEDASELTRLAVSQPQILGLSIPNNLQPTLDFFKMCIGDVKAVQLVRKCPVLMGVSLEKQLKP